MDDSASERAAMRAMLGREGYELVEAKSGEEALAWMLQRQFAVLVVDVAMPRMSGLELVSRVRERPRAAAMPVIFVTAEADRSTIEKGYAMGAVDFLVKPVVPEELRAKVGVFADLHRQRLRLEDQTARLLVAEEKERELALRELEIAGERHYRRLADAVPNVVWTADRDGVVDYYNRRWYELTGSSSGDRAGSWLSAVHPEDRERCREDWRAALSEARVFEGEYRLRAAEGGYRWHLCRAVPERGPAGAVDAWLGTFTDIEENKRAEVEREALYQQAVEAVQARDEFLSVASHELKTPVSSLGLQLGMTLRKLKKKGASELDDVVPRLESASRQVDKLGRLIVQLLDVSRLREGGIELEREEFDLARLAIEIASRFSEEATAVGSSIELSAPDPVIGCWDRLRIDQVVTNLITNALKFGAGEPIDLSVRRQGEMATIRVRDRGIGIDAEDLERIFERFERTDQAKKVRGMGLGLYIVRQIIEAHGGIIRVESAPGEGSTFTIALPFGEEKEG
ncbi:Two-component sensor histidine kinase [Vulgatibacter incomptus]|uniref:histidine kinase n=1 Tax=Vulgatibacter incomptus TaxID=1391653 RepID=A0A0K1PBQ9_9BACT|nr:Two-component sensor histidine kinase [Vulgatibacter incomptus]